MKPYTSRSEAKAQGLTQYFTGVPCKNGHLTYRYTSSGACAGCIREHNKPTANSVISVRKQLRSEFVQKRFRLYESDVGIFGTSVWAMATEILPGVGLSDVALNVAPSDRAGGTGMYAFMCHPSHIEELLSIAINLVRKHNNLTDEQVANARAKFIALGGDPDSA